MPQRSIRFPDELAAAIEAEAARLDRAFSWVVLRASEAYVARGYEPSAAQRAAMDTLASDALQMLCRHEARQVLADGSAVSCGMCGADLEVTAEDLRRLAAAQSEPASVPYADAHDGRGAVDRHLSVPPPLRHGVGPKPDAASKPRPKEKKP